MAETKLQTKSADKMLLLKDKVSVEKTTLNLAWGSPAANWVGTIPAYDENGNLLGYIPLVDTANMA